MSTLSAITATFASKLWWLMVALAVDDDRCLADDCPEHCSGKDSA